MSNYGDDDDDLIAAKVVLLGSAGVGKTCLVVQYYTGNFPSMQPPTIGASYTSKIVQLKDHKMKLQMWDTAGQERFASMASMYYRGADAAIFVFDLSDAKSLQSVRKWVKELQDHSDVSDDIVLAIAANKCDLPQSSVDQSKKLFDDAKKYSDDIGATLWKTSAKTAQGINEMFMFIAKKILDNKKEKGKLHNNEQVLQNNKSKHIFDDPASNKKCCMLL